MKPEDAKKLAEMSSIIDEKLADQDEKLHRMLKIVRKNRECIGFIFGELNTKATLLEEQGEKLRKLSIVTKEFPEEIKKVREEIVELEAEFFAIDVLEEALLSDEPDDKKDDTDKSAKPVQRSRTKNILTKEAVMDMRWKRLKSVAIRNLGCTEYHKNTDWYRNFILEHEEFIAGKVMV